MKKMLFVINPNAGRRKGRRYLADMIDVFNRAGYQVDVHTTACQGDGENAVAQRAAGMDLVVCCGGDGTFNETVSGLLKSGANVPVGYIPAGSTNDFANTLGLNKKLVKAAKQIVSGEPMDIDIGKFGDRYFTYVASFGAFTHASYATSQSVKNALGHTAYLLKGITELSQIKKVRVKLTLDDEVIEDDFIFGAICNSTSVGGVLKLDPSLVDMADGKFEIMLVHRPRSLGEITKCLRALRKKKYDCKMITFRSASHVTVTAPESMPWSLDGEKAEGQATIEVSNLYHGIKLMK